MIDYCMSKKALTHNVFEYKVISVFVVEPGDGANIRLL